MAHASLDPMQGPLRVSACNTAGKLLNGPGDKIRLTKFLAWLIKIKGVILIVIWSFFKLVMCAYITT